MLWARHQTQSIKHSSSATLEHLRKRYGNNTDSELLAMIHVTLGLEAAQQEARLLGHTLGGGTLSDTFASNNYERRL